MVHHWDSTEWEAVLEDYPVVAVDFWADWCMPCRMMAPNVDKLAETFEGKLAVGKINVDEAQDLALRYGIHSIPTVLFFKNGELVKEVVGVRTYEELQEIATRCL